jgi:hypothetical protein
MIAAQAFSSFCWIDHRQHPPGCRVVPAAAIIEATLARQDLLT